MPALHTCYLANSTTLFYIGFNRLSLIEARHQIADIVVSPQH